MSLLTSTAKLRHTTTLPADTTLPKALQILHDHDALISLDPDLVSYEPLPAASHNASANPAAKHYRVTDDMHLPSSIAHLFGSNISYTCEITDLDSGVEWVIRGPMGLVNTSRWTVEKSSEGGKGEPEAGEWTLVEDVDIKASRLLMGAVKSKCEENWRGVHGRFVERLGALDKGPEKNAKGEQRRASVVSEAGKPVMVAVQA